MTKMIPISECGKTFDFSPATLWPAPLPAYCFKNELLCGFARVSGQAVELASENLAAAFKAIYPELSFVELCRLCEKVASHQASQTSVWEIYGYRPKETLFEVAHQVLKLPMDVQHWLHQKKFAPQDLASLRSLPDLQVLNEFWPLLTNSHFSKSDGAKIIELLVELILMDTPLTSLLPQKELSFWLKQLQEQRYPRVTQNDSNAEKKIRAVAWPLKSEAKWVRKGDRAGVELKLFFSHPQELKRALERLQQVCSDLQEQTDYEDLWSRN